MSGAYVAAGYVAAGYVDAGYVDAGVIGDTTPPLLTLHEFSPIGALPIATPADVFMPPVAPPFAAYSGSGGGGSILTSLSVSEPLRKRRPVVALPSRLEDDAAAAIVVLGLCALLRKGPLR